MPFTVASSGMLNMSIASLKITSRLCSMEARMACGMGACYACVVHVKESRTPKSSCLRRRSSLSTEVIV